MVIFIAIILVLLGIISIALAIYNIYCIYGLIKFNKSVDKDTENALNGSNKFNIFIWLIRKSRKLKEENSKRKIKSIVKRKSILAIILAITILFNAIYSAFFCITMGIITAQLNTELTTVTSVLQALFSADEDCICYAECTGNAEDDKKTAYELLFGPTEYEKLIKAMKPGLTASEQEDFDELDNGDSGKDKSEFIRNHINDDMVSLYKSIVGSNNKFRADDGLDRSQMSFDELKNDLIQLFCDYKVNGVNPNCCCSDYEKTRLHYKCMGMPHYKEGWSWENLWNGKHGDSSSTSNTPGTATGKYALQLDDGSFYWYHQSQETCDYNASSDYGLVGSLHAGGASNGTMSARGCGIYSTAMALSNLLGEEITPWVVIDKVMGCPIEGTQGSYYFTSTVNNGISYSGSSVTMDMNTLASLINTAYGGVGIQASVVDFEQSTIDSYFNDSSIYAYAITSYQNSGKSSDFTWYGGAGHFMVLRPGSNGGYKCFTSASTLYGSGHENIIKGMNDELSWSAVKNHEKHGQCVMLTRNKSYYGTASADGGGSGSIGYNVEVYNALVSNGGYAGKELAMAAAYAMLEPTYGRNFAYGVMANIAAEGNFGKIEGIWTSSSPTKSKKYLLSCKCHSGYTYKYWTQVGEDVHAVANTTINSDSANVLSGIPSGVEGIGIGVVQWSGSRRATLLNIYKSMCTTYSQEELALAELTMMQQEFAGGYSGVPQSCAGQDAATCARIVCEDYEKPGNGNEASVRASIGANLSSLLSGINSSGITSNSGSSDNSQDGGSTSSSGGGQAVVDYAKGFVGNHYVYGGTTITCTNWSDSTGTDCSGFVMKVYEHFGYQLPHSSASQRSVGNPVQASGSTWTTADLKPGDIICYSGHVGIYDGNGNIVEAEGSKYGIVNNRKWNCSTVLAVRRLID